MTSAWGCAYDRRGDLLMQGGFVFGAAACFGGFLILETGRFFETTMTSSSRNPRLLMWNPVSLATFARVVRFFFSCLREMWLILRSHRREVNCMYYSMLKYATRNKFCNKVISYYGISYVCRGGVCLSRVYIFVSCRCLHDRAWLGLNASLHRCRASLSQTYASSRAG